MLELQNIHKTYNPGTVREKCLFEGFSLSIRQGQFVSIVGSNGSGKTSLLNLICGSILPDSGSIVMQGRDIGRLPEYKRLLKIGRIMQNPALGSCPNLSILENLSLADNKQRRMNLLPAVSKKRVEDYKSLLAPLGLGLENQMHQLAGALSGGQRQALAMVMSVMTPIDFLILDEHTAALDPKTSDIIMELTRQVVVERGLTALMVTHNLRHAIDYGTRLLMMHQGEVVLDRADEDKKNTRLSDVLGIFTDISVELGN